MFTTFIVGGEHMKLESAQIRNFRTTHVVNYKNCIIVIKNVPCEECEQCGEKFYTDEVAEHLEVIVNSAKKLMQEISVIDYNKAA